MREIFGKQLDLLRQAAPKIDRVSVLMNAASPTKDQFFDALSRAGQSLHIRIVRIEVRDESSLEEAVRQAAGGGLMVQPDQLFGSRIEEMVALEHRYRIATMGSIGAAARLGGGTDLIRSVSDSQLAPRGSDVDKILKGAMPGDVPVEPSSAFELIVNLKTASEFGLSIPSSLLLQADEVVR